MPDARTRFAAKVKMGAPDECWEWQAQRRNGYGVFSFQCRNEPAPRMAHYFATGEMVRDRLICHRCDNPACCNPGHLFIGTHADNMADKARKGRQFQGEAHHLSKLTEVDVRSIKRLLPSKTNTEIADRFGVSRQAIQSIRKGISWKSA